MIITPNQTSPPKSDNTPPKTNNVPPKNNNFLPIAVGISKAYLGHIVPNIVPSGNPIVPSGLYCSSVNPIVPYGNPIGPSDNLIGPSGS